MPADTLPLISYADMSAPIRGFMLVWIACLGACVGSFLNVVIYRLPRGKSIVYPGSACPACENLIRWYHNIPILSWLMLRGRCFDCGTRISARYPVVEALVAAMLLALAYVEPLTGGRNVPPTATTDAPWTMATVWAIFAYHGLLVCSLLCLALIESFEDRPAKLRLPWSLLLVPLAVGLLAPVVLPELHPESASASLPEALAASPALSAFSTGLLGLLLGLVLGGLAWPAAVLGPWRGRGAWFALAGSALVGTYLGWQAVCAVLFCTAVVHCVKTLGQVAWSSLRILTWPTILWVLTLLLILDGSVLVARWPLLQSTSLAASATVIGGACAAVFVLSFGAWLVARWSNA